jgi:hypothetical protein
VATRAQVQVLFRMTGDKALEEKLLSMEHGASAIARSAVNKGIRVISNAQKAAAPPGLKRSLGYRNKKAFGGGEAAKAGIHVGRAASAKPGRANGRTKGPLPQAHLLILGTAPRWTGAITRRSRSGHVTRRVTGNPRAFRGQIKPMNDHFVRRSTQSALPEASRVAGEAAWEKLRNLAGG